MPERKRTPNGSPQARQAARSVAIGNRSLGECGSLWRLPSALGGQLLATATTTRAKELATADGRLARKKAVATLAHEIAGLESPLHCILK